MQKMNTGLHDTNGREICWGDTLELIDKGLFRETIPVPVRFYLVPEESNAPECIRILHSIHKTFYCTVINAVH